MKRFRRLPKRWWLVAAPLGLLLVAVGLVWLGALRWQAETRELRARLQSGRVPVRPVRVDFAELAGLPDPVQRYFRAALQEGERMLAAARVRHRGRFNLSETGEQWKPFRSDQRVVVRRPGFDWDARVRMFPGAAVHVHDAYALGRGVLHASLMGLFTVAEARGAQIAEGELMRFLAEAAWYPTALLPSQGVRWRAVNEGSAIATLSDGGVQTSLTFSFAESGLIDTVFAPARGRLVEGRSVPTPWRGRFWDYEERGSMRIPLESEVAWVLPAGERPYFAARISEVVYDFAR